MSLAFRRLMGRELISSSQCKRLVGKLNLMESCYRKRMKSRFPWLGSGCLELNWIEKIDTEARISDMKCQDWLEMSALGKGGEETLYKHVLSLLQEEVVWKKQSGWNRHRLSWRGKRIRQDSSGQPISAEKIWPRHWQTPEKASLSTLHCFLKEWAKGTVSDRMQMRFSGREETRGRKQTPPLTLGSD